MAKRKALQFKITLKDYEPPIWRRIQVSDLNSFWDLHVAIQDSMGWEDYHLHLFTTKNPVTGVEERMGIPEYVYDDDALDGKETLAGWERKIKDYFNEQNRLMDYEYDFGDGWEHTIEFEGSVEKDGGKYPRCIAGEFACPPEDVGGTRGYQRYLRVISDPNHEDHRELLEWRGPFNPFPFDPQEVYFDSPSLRWKKAFGQE